MKTIIASCLLILNFSFCIRAQNTPNKNSISLDGLRLSGKLFIYNSPDYLSTQNIYYFGVTYGIFYEHLSSKGWITGFSLQSLSEVQQYDHLVVQHDLYGDKVADAFIMNNYFSYRLSFGKTLIHTEKHKINFQCKGAAFVRIDHLIGTNIKGKYYYPDISTTEKFDLLASDLDYVYVSYLSYGVLLDVRLIREPYFIGFRQEVTAGSKMAPQNLKIYNNFGLNYGYGLNVGLYF